MTPLGQRSAREVERLVERFTPSRLPEETKRELTRLMEALPSGEA